MHKQIEALTVQDAIELNAKREWVKNHYANDQAAKYQSLEGKLLLLSEIISRKLIGREERLKLQCLGVTFGDALKQYFGLEWVIVNDEFGREFALQKPGSTVLIFPLTSISKRIEQGEDIDARKLFDTAVSAIKAQLP